MALKIAKKNRKKYNKRQQQEVSKASSEDVNTSRLRLGELGTVGMAAVTDYIDLIMPYELGSYSNRIKTFDKMSLNSAVSTALDFNYILVEKAFANAKVVGKANSEVSEEAAKFVEYNFKNMRNQTLRQAVRNIISFKKYGFSIAEKNFEKIKTGTYAGKYPFKLKSLAYRPQGSLNCSTPFKFSKDGRQILYARQDTSYFKDNDGFSNPRDHGSIYKEIPRKKFMLFGYNSTESNPFGESPLVGCFRDVKEMDIINEYQTVGVTRDMGGMLVFGVPSEILNKAAEDPTGPEARSIERLEEQGALCHAGEQTSMIIPRELLEGSSNQEAYTMKFQGVEGSGKMFQTESIIKAKQKAIFDRFGAGHMILGEGGGSYALIEGKNNIHTHYIDRDVQIILEVLNNDLIPQLLSLNGINLPEEEMPKLVAGDIEPVSYDEMSKMLQRTGAVGLLPSHDPLFLNEMYERLDFKYRFKDNISLEELADKLGDVTTRSGDGMTSGMPSGVGNATGGGDTSTGNVENT